MFFFDESQVVVLLLIFLIDTYTNDANFSTRRFLSGLGKSKGSEVL